LKALPQVEGGQKAVGSKGGLFPLGHAPFGHCFCLWHRLPFGTFLSFEPGRNFSRVFQQGCENLYALCFADA